MKRSKNEPEIIDVSTVISEETHVYPGDPKPVISRISGPDNSTSLSLLSINTHTGTHIDPPLHFFKEKKGVDKLELNSLVGWAEVHDLTQCKEITENELKKLNFREDIILLKTGCYESYLTKDAAVYLAGMNTKTVGIDSLSVDSRDSTNTHRILLEKEIIIIEGLNFEEVSAGRYYFICLPLKIKEGDGGPARAIIIKNL